MAEALRLLHEEHANMTKLLRLLDDQIALFGEGGAPDFGLMLDVMDYMANYPDHFHHPKEDLVFEKLAERAADARAAVGELLEEHAELARMTGELEAALNEVALDAEVPREHLVRLARAYVELLRRHMAKEEETVLPRAAEALTEDDWSEVDAALTAGDDPLFGSTSHKRYETLRESLVRYGA